MWVVIKALVKYFIYKNAAYLPTKEMSLGRFMVIHMKVRQNAVVLIGAGGSSLILRYFTRCLVSD